MPATNSATIDRRAQAIAVGPRLDGKVIIITGAASGIGLAAVELFAGLGASVVAVDRDPVGARPGEDDVRGLQADVTDDEQVRAMVGFTLEQFGRLDGAFNNAGITLSRADVHEADVDEWHTTIDVNLNGVFLCMRHEITAMLAAGPGIGGSIVNTASIAGVRAAQTLAAYTASKHGVVGLTKVAAQEYATRGIRVNAILPGLVRTPMLERSIGDDAELRARYDRTAANGRMAEPVEIASLAAWLSCDAASYVSGASIPIDGGGGS